MTQCLKRLWTEEKGESLPEFALLLFLVCLTAVSAMGGVATKVDSMYYNVSTHVAVAANPALTGGANSVVTGPLAETRNELKDTSKQNPAN
jgi:Flp pilus assembly pilin Flp